MTGSLSLRTSVVKQSKIWVDREHLRQQSLFCCWVDIETGDRHVALLLAMTDSGHRERVRALDVKSLDCSIPRDDRRPVIANLSCEAI